MAKKKDLGITAKGTKKKATQGRKIIISEEIIKNIIFSLKAGCYLETAAAYAGISKNTLFQWLKRGRREKRRLAADGRRKMIKSEAQFVILVDAVTRAMSESEVRDVSVIAQAANGGHRVTETKVKKDSKGNLISEETVEKAMPPQWQAAAWRLERKFPKKWGKRLAVRKDEGKDLENSPDAYIKKLREEFAEMSGLVGCGNQISEGSQSESRE